MSKRIARTISAAMSVGEVSWTKSELPKMVALSFGSIFHSFLT